LYFFIFFFIVTAFCTILDSERESGEECIIYKLKVTINEGSQFLLIYFSFPGMALFELISFHDSFLSTTTSIFDEFCENPIESYI